MPKNRAAALAPQTGSWGVRLAVDNDRDPFYPLRREVAVRAHECVAAHESMQALIAALPAGTSPASLVHKPAFAELVQQLARSFESLTEAVDACLQAGVPWRDLVTCERVLAAIDIGLERERQIIASRAYSRFLREHQPL